MREDDGQCGTCKPFTVCDACIFPAEKSLHTCGRAIAFAAEAATRADSPTALQTLSEHPSPKKT
jgi:hypothetical protein